jgi:prepilin-type N-terminal cleavage/methylation domain-containing protein
MTDTARHQLATMVAAPVRVRLPSPRLQSDDGLTIVELVMALAIFALLSTGVVATMVTALDLSRTNRNRVVASNLAAEEMDRLRSLAAADFTSVAPGAQVLVRTAEVNNVTFEIRTDRQWIEVGARTDACKATDGSDYEPRYVRLSVRVTWPDMRAVQPIRSDTILTPPLGTVDDLALGNVAVQVRDRDGAAVEDQVVVLTRPDSTTQTATTTATGCAFFNFLPGGSYAVTLDRAGWVNPVGSRVSSENVGVQAGKISTIEMVYDRDVDLALTFANFATHPVPAGMSFSLFNTNFATYTITFVDASATGPERTVVDFFPFTDGVYAWAGICLDADPGGADRRDPLLLIPGSTATGTIATAPVDVTVLEEVDGVFAPRSGVAVTAVHDPLDGCQDGETYPLGDTDAGGVVRASLPAGLWRFEITDPVIDGYPDVVLTTEGINGVTLQIDPSPDGGAE